MDIRTAFSSYLKAADIPGPTNFVIRDVQIESLKDRDGKEEHKPVIYFTNTTKGMVLNQTNGEALAYVCGSYDTATWTGKTVTLHTPMVEAFGKIAPAIRVLVQQPAQPAVPAAPPPAPGAGPLGPNPPAIGTSVQPPPAPNPNNPDDDIPF